MEKKLNAYLSDLVVEYHKLQSFHWYVKGSDFFTVHEKLEEYLNEVAEMIDEVAEAMLMCGMRPVSTLEDFAGLSTINEVKGELIASGDAYAQVIEDYGHLLGCAKAIKSAAEEGGNYLVSVKIDGHIEAFSKALWTLGQLCA